ncbi:hypothetical protein, partial [Vibrio cholerae]|uniref:hypothetical protein n=1 Tax=Vibrio cholerae TaxID=666 RepID=UPI0021CCAB4A
IDQQLHTSLGDSPPMLRDLSVSFIKLGEIEEQLGDLHAAKAAYAQSLAIASNCTPVSAIHRKCYATYRCR